MGAALAKASFDKDLWANRRPGCLSDDKALYCTCEEQGNADQGVWGIPMSKKGYIIIRIEVEDPIQYSKYTAKAAKLLESIGARYIARGGQMEHLEGAEEDNRRVVIMEFPSYEAARNYYFSEDYRALKALRNGASDAKFVLVEGV